jgi:hypothetical protein
MSPITVPRVTLGELQGELPFGHAERCLRLDPHRPQLPAEHEVPLDEHDVVAAEPRLCSIYK